MPTLKPIVGFHRDAHGVAGLIMLPTPAPCSCGRMVALLVNRDGATRCVECDEQYLIERAKEVPR